MRWRWVATLGLTLWQHAGTQQILWLSHPNAIESEASALTPDAQVVLGSVRLSDRWVATRWLAGTPELIGAGEHPTWGIDIAPDGDLAVCQRETPLSVALLWTLQYGIHELASLTGRDSLVVVCTADGRWAFGTSFDSANNPVVVRWNLSTGAVSLVPLPGNPKSYLHGASSDGAVLVGRLGGASRSWFPFRWSAAQGQTQLSTAQGTAWAVSPNGVFVVGHVALWNGEQAFRWDAQSGLQLLGTLNGLTLCRALHVSNDGRVVVGYASRRSGGSRAFIWTPERGLEDLTTRYASLLPPTMLLIEARRVSPDGRYIVGVGIDTRTHYRQGFLLDRGANTGNPADVNSDGCVDDADLLAVLFAFGQSGASMREDVNSDGIVDDADLLTVLFAFGQGC
jgi:probable HAF family extracellular repeat protein